MKNDSDAKKLLTSLELKVMNVLWKLEKAFVKEIIEEWDEKPRPAYNTISTVVRILEEKGFVGHAAFGRSHQYFAEIPKQDYQKRVMSNVLDNVFAGSVTNMISSLVGSHDLSDTELDDLKSLIEKSEE